MGAYHATLESLDFKGNTEGSRKHINQWVEEQTEKLIKDLIPQGGVDSDTRLVVANAIYFLGSWVTEFEKDLTKAEPFTTGKGAKVDVQMMRHKGGKVTVPYAENDELQAVALPYTGKDMSMLVLLPKKNDLAGLEKRLSAESLADIGSQLAAEKVDVHLPKFKVDATYALNNELKEMGMRKAFNMDLADLSGMTGSRDLCISQVFHKAYVDVNEKGTEAAAATAVVVMRCTSFRPDLTKRFYADHPFAYMIRHDPTGQILFMGKYETP